MSDSEGGGWVAFLPLRDVPKGWEVSSIGDVCRIEMGQSPPSSTYNRNQIGLPFFQGKAEFGRLYPEVEKYCSEPKKVAPEGSILLSVRAPVGPTNLAPADSCIGRGLASVQPMGGISTEYLLYYFRAIESDLSGVGTGSTFKAINGAYLRSIAISLPPINEQRRIVAKIEELFSELDNGVESLKAARVQLKNYRQSLLKAAFEGRLTEQWRHSNRDSVTSSSELKSALFEFNKSKMGKNIPRRLPPVDLSGLPEIPNSWIWAHAHEVCGSVRDGTHDTPRYVNSGVPLVTSKNLRDGYIDFSSASLIAKDDHDEIRRRSGVEAGDILFGMIGTIGNPVVVSGSENFSIKNVGLFKGNGQHVLPEYLQAYLSSAYCEEVLRKKELIRGTTQKFISLGGLRILPVPLPGKNEQEVICAELDRRMSLVSHVEQSLEAEVSNSERLRKAILERAFEGKLVPQDPEDEPASALLERIRTEQEQAPNPRGRRRKANA